MAANNERDFHVLGTVHSFYLELLRKSLGYDVPVPSGLEDLCANAAVDNEQTTALLHQWLNLLDLAISPPMVRDTLQASLSHETAEALLCYFTHKSATSDSDRDKTDFTVTFLYRHPRIPGAWDVRVELDQASAFEQAVMAVIGEDACFALPQEHSQLVREFDYIREEVEDFQTFDAMMDAGVVQRVRDIKQSLGRSFYHPHVLGTVALHNDFFRERFDELFHAAAREIKMFAAKVQQDGASSMSRVHGDVLVKQLNDLEESKIFNTDYGKAQDQMRELSKLKKAVDTRKTPTGPPRANYAALPPPPPSRTAPSDHAMIAAAARANSSDPGARPLPMGIDISGPMEEAKLRTMKDTIRNFVRAAEAKAAQVVPLRHGNLVLTQPEADSFRGAFADEVSFRGDCVRVYVENVAVGARIAAELAEYSRKASSAYLWKPHADSLTILLETANRAVARSQQVTEVAQQRGLAEKVAQLKASSQKVCDLMGKVVTALQSVDSRTQNAQ